MAEVSKMVGKEFTASRDVLSFLGARSCKIIYRMRRQKGLQGHGERASDRGKGSSLFVLDYVEGKEYPDLIQFPDEPRFKSFAPLIHPDGKRVVYNQSFGATDIMVLSLDDCEPVKVAEGANPHWHVNQETGKTYIVYRDNNDCFVEVPQPGKTLLLEMDDKNQPVGDPELIVEHGYAGGISTDGRYLATGFMIPCAYDRKTGRLSAPIGTVLREPGHSNQCCCCSVSPDDTGRFMVLRWPHERITLFSFDGGLRTDFPVPDGKEEWQTPEWSTNPDFFAGVGMNQDLIYDIFLARISDKQYLQISTDGGYVHAHPWVGPGK